MLLYIASTAHFYPGRRVLRMIPAVVRPRSRPRALPPCRRTGKDSAADSMTAAVARWPAVNCEAPRCISAACAANHLRPRDGRGQGEAWRQRASKVSGGTEERWPRPFGYRPHVPHRDADARLQRSLRRRDHEGALGKGRMASAALSKKRSRFSRSRRDGHRSRVSWLSRQVFAQPTGCPWSSYRCKLARQSTARKESEST